MPVRPLHECQHPGCHILSSGSLCAKHQAGRKQKQPDVLKVKRDRNRLNSNQRGYTYRWQNARKMFLARNPWCAQCLKASIHRAALVVDHIIPHRMNQQIMWDEENWQALCETCHNIKSARERR